MGASRIPVGLQPSDTKEGKTLKWLLDRALDALRSVPIG